MLSKDNLSQLKQLKKDIHQSKERYKGKVKGTLHRHGFLQQDNGKQLLLPHTEMERVFPGDSIKVVMEKDDKGKDYAKVESLIDSPLGRFTGQIVVKGNNYFVKPDVAMMQRWLFIPPAKRNGAAQGDYAECKVTRHPFKNGKPQASVEHIIGSDSVAGIEHQYIDYKYKLQAKYTDAQVDSLKQRCEQRLAVGISQRLDLSEVPFITIDAAHSEDLDDALYAEETADGWLLWIAIADPNAFIDSDDDIDRMAQQHIASSYLPGQTFHMLPNEIATNYGSLLPTQKRLALVCKASISKQGKLEGFEFLEAAVESKQKLDYAEVAAIIDTIDPATLNDNEGASNQALILNLWNLRNALYEYRTTHHLVMDEKADFELQLDAQKKIQTIIKHERNNAQRLVEECMICANQCATAYIDEHKLSAPFISHPGFRADKISQVNEIVKQYYPDFSLADVKQLPHYVELIKHLKTTPCDEPILDILSRLLKPSKISQTAGPHMGMGLSGYTSCTSPLRKYHDLLVHRAIKSHLTGGMPNTQNAKIIDQLQERNQTIRQAIRELEHWLKCQFATQHIGKQMAARLSRISGQSITITLKDWDATAQIDKKQLPGKYKFNQLLMQLSSKDHCFKLEQSLDVVIKKVDMQRRTIWCEPLLNIDSDNTGEPHQAKK